LIGREVRKGRFGSSGDVGFDGVGDLINDKMLELGL
jgi:hypothetical protein